jgi:hypothetical protein
VHAAENGTEATSPAEHFDQLVAAKHDLAAGSVARRLEKATRAAPLRGVGRDFGSALLANSDYRGSFRGSLSHSALLLCKILPEVTPGRHLKIDDVLFTFVLRLLVTVREYSLLRWKKA